MSIGIWQIALILVIVLILFGAGRLPRVMGDVAKGIKSFKSGMKEEVDDVTASTSAKKVEHSDKTDASANDGTTTKPADAEKANRG